MTTETTSNTEPDEPDLDPDAPGLHQWVRHRLDHQPTAEPSAVVAAMGDPSSAWGAAARRAGVPAAHLREVLVRLETSMYRLDNAELADLTPDSPAVTMFLEAAAREHA
jgi:hypothetical protein